MFDKGQSGNPGGRPRKSQQQRDFESKCADWSALYAFDKLKKHSEHEEPKVFMWAISELLNRGFGKPTEFVEANVTSDTGVSAGEVAAGIAALIGSGQAASGNADSQAPVDGGK